MGLTMAEDQPVSPNGYYFNSSAVSIHVLAVLETEKSFDDSQFLVSVRTLFLSINPRFCSIIVNGTKGKKSWKRVEVNLRNHVYTPIFPHGKPPEFYDQCFSDYLSKLSAEELPQSQPLWQIHVVKFPTNSGDRIVFKLHHALGDGYSLMGALLSCLERADGHLSLPLTFPSLRRASDNKDGRFLPSAWMMARMGKAFSVGFNTVSDLCFTLCSRGVQDDVSPIRSENPDGLGFLPISVATTTLMLDDVKRIKCLLGCTVNELITGAILLGARLYMEGIEPGTGNARSTAVVLLNTRMIKGYKSIQEMKKPDRKSASSWGNQVASFALPIPKLQGNEDRPLEFVRQARKTIQRKKKSLAVYLAGMLTDRIRKTKGAEAAAALIGSTIRSTSVMISSIVGPTEKVSIGNQPIKGIYFVVAGKPQSLSATVMSYMGDVRITIGGEKDFVDSNKLISCIETAFEIISKAACN
ncbi:Wax ester synthase/diacylglycerol acyltransferase 11 [Linum grandiflorum]